MDGDRFDTLTRSFTASGSRRRALALALSGALAPLLGPTETDAHNPLKKCKKKSGKQKKACVKKAKKHNATHTTPPPSCTPSCGGQDCGDDGCGGSCGPCTGGACTAGACVCPGGTEVCAGGCVTLCNSERTRDPVDCGCCKTGNIPCGPPYGANPDCCSRFCQEETITYSYCRDKWAGETCEFNAQCATNFCTDGICRCQGGLEPCKRNCLNPCPQGQTRNPETCGCCITNGSNCASESTRCCAGSNRCTGAGNTTCAGLLDGQSCEFDAQCASRFGCIDGTCGGVVG